MTPIARLTHTDDHAAFTPVPQQSHAPIRSPFLPPARRLLALLAWLVGWPGRIAAIRRDMRLLGSMDDRHLADIGLIRQDLWDATVLPTSTHPGAFLDTRADERRRNGRDRFSL